MRFIWLIQIFVLPLHRQTIKTQINMENNSHYIVKFSDDSMIAFDNVYEYIFFTSLRNKRYSCSGIVLILVLTIIFFLFLIGLYYLCSYINNGNFL